MFGVKVDELDHRPRTFERVLLIEKLLPEILENNMQISSYLLWIELFVTGGRFK